MLFLTIEHLVEAKRTRTLSVGAAYTVAKISSQPPMWIYGCGVWSSGLARLSHLSAAMLVALIRVSFGLVAKGVLVQGTGNILFRDINDSGCVCVRFRIHIG